MAGVLAPWHSVTLAAIIAVLFLGRKRLPGVGRALGQAVSAFRTAWREGPQGPSQAKETGPSRRPSPAVAPDRQAPPRARAGLLRMLSRSPRGRRLAFWSILALAIAYLAGTLTDELFAGSSFRSKAVAFLVIFALGIASATVFWLWQRRKRQAARRLDP